MANTTVSIEWLTKTAILISTGNVEKLHMHIDKFDSIVRLKESILYNIKYLGAIPSLCHHEPDVMETLRELIIVTIVIH